MAKNYINVTILYTGLLYYYTDTTKFLYINALIKNIFKFWFIIRILRKKKVFNMEASSFGIFSVVILLILVVLAALFVTQVGKSAISKNSPMRVGQVIETSYGICQIQPLVTANGAGMAIGGFVCIPLQNP